ncbi:hypothetical protein SEUCBS140593_010724 [Sporothrix eucalyptigena]|uniref:Phytanoyl-CoA dioxygenase n=1 Tax=Sporothrix eucalyptigena TaxID=1812306 RepID=A0ABP0D344_9PEZI
MVADLGTQFDAVVKPSASSSMKTATPPVRKPPGPTRLSGGLGFKRYGPSTIKESNLPIINEKGMVIGYGVAYEGFVLDIRQEPGVLEAFTKVYDTPDLIVSFENVNMAFPNGTDLPPNKPLPHQDQDPKWPGFRGMQGIINIFPNCDDDGGLIASKGGHLLSEEFHEHFKNDPPPLCPSTTEWYGYKEEGLAWLKDRGCEWVKVNTEPRDLILWNSRTPHYNLSPTGTNPRFCAYTCYMPAAEATQEDIMRKKIAFETTQSTTHLPDAIHVGGVPIVRDGKPRPYNTGKPRQPPRLGEVGMKLTGIPTSRLSKIHISKAFNIRWYIIIAATN